MQKELESAIHGKDIEVTRSLIMRGVDINAPTGYQKLNAVELALSNHTTNHLDVLLEAGAKIRLTSYNGNSILNEFIENPLFDAEKLKIFVSKMDVPDENYFKSYGHRSHNPLFKAVKQKHITPEHIDFLVELGFPLQTALEENPYDSLLSVAAQYANLDVLKCVYKYDNSVNKLVGYGKYTPLVMAIEGNNPDNVDWLISQGASLKYNDKKGCQVSVMHKIGGSYRVIEVLLKNGCDINEVNELGQTCAMLASYPSIKELVRNGANVHLLDNELRSVLYYAAAVNNPKTIPLLLELGININQQDSAGITPLMIAVEKLKTVNIDIFLKNNADVNISDHSGKSALLHHTSHEERGIISSLLNAGADIDHQDCDGNTILLQEARKKRTEGVKVLVERGADINIRNNKGQSVVEIINKRRKVSDKLKSIIEFAILADMVDDDETNSPGI